MCKCNINFFNTCLLFSCTPLICIFIFLFTTFNSFIFLFFYTAAYCSPPNNPVNGTVHSLTGTKLGSTLRFSCDQGFRLIGQSSATCVRTAQGIFQWNAPVPLCQGEVPIMAAELHWIILIQQIKNHQESGPFRFRS